jgi:hypothetical protein
MNTRKTKRPLTVRILVALIIFSFFSGEISSAQTVIKNSWDGYDMSPHAQYRFLNLFVNIIYDQCDDPDTLNICWPKITDTLYEGINNQAIPCYLNSVHPDLLDVEFTNTSSVHGSMTKRYYESSFGHLTLLGDYVLVNIRQSSITPLVVADSFGATDIISKCLELINNAGGLSTLFGHESIDDYDSDNDGDIDYFQVCVRNGTEKFGNRGPGQGVSWGNSDFPILMSNGDTAFTDQVSYQCVGSKDISKEYTCVIYHEFSHHLFGGNNVHASGGCMWRGDGGGISFLGNQGGYGIMGGGNSGLISCNGYERWRMHWKNDAYNTTNSYIVANNQQSDISKEDGAIAFLLRDFVTTGDAVRIKLPYKDAGGLNQYIWLENHKTETNEKLDFLIYYDDSIPNCRPFGKSGIYAYYQVGKDILTGDSSTVVYPSFQADNLKIISADGNADRIYGDFQTSCIGSGEKKFSKDSLSNPFLGVNDVMKQGVVNVNTGDLKRSDFYLVWKRIYPDHANDSIPHLMDERDPFRGTGKINLCSNPASVNTYTYYNEVNGDDFNPINPTLNTRTIYLSGLSISYTRQSNDDYIVNIVWDDYEVNKEVRWCGNIILKENMNLVESANVILDQSLTPNQKNRDLNSGVFSLPTKLTCESGSKVNLSNESQIRLINKSSIVLEAGSFFEIQDESALIVNAGCTLEVKSCATLIIKSNGQLIVESGGTICIQPGALIYINSSQNILLNSGYQNGSCSPITPLTIENYCKIQPSLNFQQGTTTWQNKSYGFIDDLIVPSGSVLDILNSHLEFSPNTKVIIQPNGKLILNNSTLSNSDTTCFNTLWKGVEVWGNSTSGQYPTTNQGSLHILDGGSIENAQIGILVSKRDCNDCNIPTPGFSGGIVMCDSAFLVNNKIGVLFAPYSFVNHSTFNRVNFISNDAIKESIIPDYFAKLQGVNLILFKGCTFKNIRTDNQFPPEYYKRGIGIFSINSNFRVQESCLSNNTPCSQIRQSVFEKLFKGIYALNSGTSFSPVITNSFFLENQKGLYLSGFNNLSNVSITKNKFRIMMPLSYSLDSIYGMYLDQCSGYHVEQNEYFAVSTQPNWIGLVVNNSGPFSNEIYRNTFYNLKYATLSQNYNRNGESEGLCYKCNQFVKDDGTMPNTYDFSITSDTVNYPHNDNTGIAKNQGSLIDPAGNMFVVTPAQTPYHYDFWNYGHPIEYYYEGNNQTGFRLMPLFNNIVPSNSVNTTVATVPPYEVVCPSKLGGGIQLEEELNRLTESENKSDSIGNVLNALVDGGSTDLLNFEVITSTPPEALQTRNELIEESPYLSDTVMKTSILKEDVLDNTMIRDVLVANPQSAKSDEVMFMLETRAVPMPDYMISQILAGADTVGAKEILEAETTSWINKATQSYIRLLNYYKGDSISSADEDSLNWLFSFHNTLASQYNKAEWLNANGDHQLAKSTLEAIPGLFTLSPSQVETNNRYIDFVELYEQIYSDTTGLFNIDSTTAVSLQTIALSNSGVPTAFARNILIANGLINYTEPILLSDSNLKSSDKEEIKGAKSSGDDSFLTVYPNPAKSYFVVKFKVEQFLKPGSLNLYDENGKKVKSLRFTSSKDQLVFPVTDLQSGVYIMSLESGRTRIESVKITIIK